MVAVLDPWWLVAAKLAAVLFLVALNGFFVAAEFAIVKVRATQVDARVRAGDRRAGVAKHLLTNLDAYLSACQLGITLASLGLGWIGEPAVATLITPALEAVGIANPTVVSTVSFILAFSAITFLHITFGEQAPKILAITHSEGTTLRVSRPLRVFYALFKPGILLINSASNVILRAVGVQPASGGEVVHSEEELQMLLAASGRARRLDKKRAEILLNVFELKDFIARQIMTPRTQVVTVDLRRPLNENLRIAEESGFTRFPLVDGTLDNLLGFVHYRDLVRLARNEANTSEALLTVKRDVLLVPESRAVEALLQEMLSRGRNMAVLVDEHGSVSGIATLEDIFEEIFGDIRGEFEQRVESVTPTSRGYILDGALPLHDASEALNTQLRSVNATTVAGYVMERLGRIPKKGDRVRVGPYEAVVREVQKHRVRQVEFRKVRPLHGPSED